MYPDYLMNDNVCLSQVLPRPIFDMCPLHMLYPQFAIGKSVGNTQVRCQTCGAMIIITL